jgi:ABC-type multidrug transport system fused ATPase/permease subunit
LTQGTSITASVLAMLRLLPGRTRRRLRLAVLLAVVLAVVEAVAIGGLAVVIKLVADADAGVPSWAKAFADDRDSLVARGGIVVFVLLLVRTLLGFMAARLQASLQAETDAELGIRIFGRALRYPYSVHLRRSSSEFVGVLGWCVADVSANLVGATALLAVDALMLVALAGTLVAIQPLVAAGLIAYFSIVAAALVYGPAKGIRRIAQDEQAANVATNRAILEGLQGVKAFQVAVATQVVADEHSHERRRLALTRQRKTFYAATIRQVLEASVTLGIAALALALFTLTSSTEAVASLGVVVAVAFRALPSVARMLGTLSSMRSASVSLAAVQSELAQTTTQDDDPSSAITFERGIEFEDVTFQYAADGPPALQHVTLQILRGMTLGVVGSSGAGKTTLVDLLLGLLRPSTGAISVDGEHLDQGNVLAWRRLVGYVPQDVFLLDSTVRDNVVFAGRGVVVDDEAVWAALQQAQLAEFVRSMPAALDTVVGERGSRMSGGQRQRLGIARALYRGPRVLILDEATSALDLKTEAAVARTIEALDSSMTKILIAHRLSTVRNCDQIAFFDTGRVVGTGTFDELVEAVPQFAELARLGGLARAPVSRA